MADPAPRHGIMNDIVKWGRENADKIAEAYSFNGGWEGWVQVEPGIALKRAFSHPGNPPNWSITVTREVPVYQRRRDQRGDQRSDLLITTRKGREIDTNMLELKCESSSSGAGAFFTAVAKDCEKIDDASIRAQYLPCKAWVVAFSVTERNNLSSLTVGGTNLRPYPERIPAGRITITLYYGFKDFQRLRPQISPKL